MFTRNAAIDSVIVPRSKDNIGPFFTISELII